MAILPDNWTVEVDFPADVLTSTYFFFDDPSRGQFDTGGVLAPDVTWADITSFVRSGSISRGMTSLELPYTRADAGKCQLVLNNLDGRFDPSWTAGPYAAAGVSQVVPMRRFRVRDGGTTLFYGYADEWLPTYPAHGHDAIVTLTGTDGVKVLAAFNGPEQSSQGADETSGARVARVLDNAQWPGADRLIDAGDVQFQATTLAQPAWTELQLASDTELGELFVDAGGRLVFRSRGGVILRAGAVEPQAVFGTGDGDLPYTDVQFSMGDQDIRNQVRIARNGGVEQLAEDSDSQARFLVHTLARTDLIHRTDGESLDYAQYVLALLSQPAYRLRSLSVDMGSDPASLYPAVLPLDFGDRIRVSFTAPGPGEIVKDAYVRGIQHTFSTRGWQTALTLQDAGSMSFLIFDNTTTGLLDTGRLAI